MENNYEFFSKSSDDIKNKEKVIEAIKLYPYSYMELDDSLKCDNEVVNALLSHMQAKKIKNRLDKTFFENMIKRINIETLRKIVFYNPEMFKYLSQTFTDRNHVSMELKEVTSIQKFLNIDTPYKIRVLKEMLISYETIRQNGLYLENLSTKYVGQFKELINLAMSINPDAKVSEDDKLLGYDFYCDENTITSMEKEYQNLEKEKNESLIRRRAL